MSNRDGEPEAAPVEARPAGYQRLGRRSFPALAKTRCSAFIPSTSEIIWGIADIGQVCRSIHVFGKPTFEPSEFARLAIIRARWFA